ncbi:MAG: hypothetical protein QXT73_02650 [Candidatus Methanomethylicaceae archaeon]
MTNPLACLSPALAAICEKGKVLPATGQALIDLVGPDQDETFDRLLTDAEERFKPVDLVLEPPPWKLYHHLNPRPRRDDHVFRYFLDGSARTYFLGTVVERERSSPVQFAQVGAAAVYRENEGRLLRAGAERRLILMLSKEHVSPELWEAVASRVQALPDLELRNSGEKDPVTDGVQVAEPRFRGAHKANWFMREAERDLARKLLTELPEGAWLVLDGGLGKDILTWTYLKKWDHPPLIGVCKSFSKEPCFKVGGGPGGKILNLYELLARLEHGCRTAVFGAEGGKKAFWYVRLRPQGDLDYPLMGVIKVEMPNPKREAIPTELIDRLSGALLAERSVTPHGRDSRWHAHLYPISVAERLVKGLFFSEEVLRAAIRWPVS